LPGAPRDFVPQTVSDEDIERGVRYWDEDYEPVPVSPAPALAGVSYGSGMIEPSGTMPRRQGLADDSGLLHRAPEQNPDQPLDAGIGGATAPENA
jgi:hypothetical protein